MSQDGLDSGSKRYVLSPEVSVRHRRSLFIRTGVAAGLWVIIMVGMGVYGYVITGNADGALMMSSMLCTGLVFGLVLMGGFLWLNLTITRKSLNGYEVRLGDDWISVKSMEVDAVTMRRDEITVISENKRYGLIIRAGNRPVMLIVNKDVEGYDEIKSVLTGWHSLADKPQRIIPPVAIGLIFGAALLGVALAPNWQVAVAVWLLGTIWLGYQIVVLIRVPEVKGTSRALGIAFQVFLFVALSMHALNSMLRTSPELIGIIRSAIGTAR